MNSIKVLLVGDIVGKAGRIVLMEFLSDLKREFSPDFCIVNVENAAGGKGITRKVLEEIRNCKVDCLTSGNHIFDKKEVFKILDDYPELLRPLNYPPGVPGRGYILLKKNEKKLLVFNLIGRVFMGEYDCPFRTLESHLKEIQTPCIVVDFHAETTSEKKAFALYFDGKVSAVIGTHTHVQTADECILPLGTAFITDVGMTGSFDSVIGVNKEKVLERFLYQTPVRFEPAKGKLGINSVFLEIDSVSGKALKIERVNRF